MSTECYSMVRGSIMRVTKLDKRGYPWVLGWPVTYAASRGVSRIALDPVVEQGGSEMLRSLDEQRRILLVRNDETIRYLMNATFTGVDPGLLSLMANVPLVTNAAGDIVGFDSTTKLRAASYALEVWTKLAGSACADGIQRWGYTVFPFLKGGWLSGFTFSNTGVTFSLEGAQTQRANKWGRGPYSIDHGPDPVSGNTPFRQTISYIVPPQPSQGIEEVFEGGDASMTSDNVLDGEFVVTSPRVVDGGEA